MALNFFKFKKILSHRDPSEAAQLNRLSTHVFVIPSFKEDLEVLKGTVGFLASHPFASTYCVFMAMEKREKEALQKV